MIGNYELLDMIGSGGMGEIYRARDHAKDRVVALKLLRAHLAGDATFVARFRREARLAGRLTNAHTVPIHDFGEIEGRLFIDMRMVSGADLATVLSADGSLPPKVAVDIVRQTASALDSAHDEGLIHRDVKPGNVMLTELTPGYAKQPFAYLLDFGIARSMDRDSLRLTSVGAAAIGSVAYMAPEWISADDCDHRADVYSLACVLYQSLTGELPYPGDFMAVLYQHLNKEAPRASAINPAVPAALDEVIARGMAKDPAQRIQRAGDLAAAAEAALTPVLTTAPVPVAAPTTFGPVTLSDAVRPAAVNPRETVIMPTVRPAAAPAPQANPRETVRVSMPVQNWPAPPA